MISLIQRVERASVSVNGVVISHIQMGLLVLLGIEQNDAEPQIKRMAQRLLAYRVFEDGEGKMNLSLSDVEGEMLIVSQFTLVANTQKGMRPSFSSAADPRHANKSYERVLECCRQQYDKDKVFAGQFAADMKVELVNDGPVSFILNT